MVHEEESIDQLQGDGVKLGWHGLPGQAAVLGVVESRHRSRRGDGSAMADVYEVDDWLNVSRQGARTPGQASIGSDQ